MCGGIVVAFEFLLIKITVGPFFGGSPEEMEEAAHATSGIGTRA
jgi:hypothetical protein